MNQEKMGQFIASLRKEKNLTQYELADLLHISREAISKWENGRSCPDPQVLIKLSEIFNVTINELLYGEKSTKDNTQKINDISLELYKDKNKKRKIIKGLIICLTILILSFLSYYFITTYNSLKVYFITDDNDIINNGILVMTNEELYFNIGDITTNEPIKSLELFYKNKENKDVVISKANTQKIIFSDKSGYNQYFDFDNINYIIKNLYLTINYENNNETIKLKIFKSFSNDYIISDKTTPITDSKNEQLDYSKYDNKIKEKFNCTDSICTLSNKDYNLIYLLDSHLLMIDFNNANEKIVYIPTYQELTYENTTDDKVIDKFTYNFNDNKYNCEVGKCKTAKNLASKIKIIIDSIF